MNSVCNRQKPLLSINNIINHFYIYIFIKSIINSFLY